METRASKRRRLDEELIQKTRDRISDLPDGILHHILSFLSLESMAQTSVLSKRWTYIWRSCPCLDFSTLHRSIIVQPPLPANPPISMKRLRDLEAKLMRCVSTVLSLRDDESNIKTFRLVGHVTHMFLRDCFRRLVNHGVEELVLDVHLRGTYDLPKCIFTCQTLQKLTINPKNHQNPSSHPPLYNSSSWFGFSIAHAIASSNGLKSVHTLLFTCVNFTGTGELFWGDNFPLLRKMCLKECKGIAHLNINCPCLEDLELYDLWLSSLDIYGARLESLRVTRCFHNCGSESSVKIIAPSLKFFHWQYNAMMDKCSMDRFESLHRSSIFYLPETLNEAKLQTAATLLSVLPLAQYVSVGSQVVRLLSDVDFAGGLPNSFNHLVTLDLYTGLNKRDILGIVCLLRSSPVLHTLKIVILTAFDRTRNNTWNRHQLDNSNFTEEQYLESQAQHLKSFDRHLKFVMIKVRGVKIYESAVNLVKFLLKHGRVLEQMTLRSSKDTPKDPSPWQQRIGSEVMEFPQASSSVRISLI